MPPDVGLPRHAELALVGRVGGENPVIAIDHDHRLRIVFEVGDERAEAGGRMGGGGLIGLIGRDDQDRAALASGLFGRTKRIG
ncbi:hypothetical protein BGC_33520 [Burkholderia sp. 3C]